MSATIRRYIREKQDFEYQRGWQGSELQASLLRQAFIKRFVVNFDTNLYKTQEERDWAYICKRYPIPITAQYNYDVVLKGLGYSFFVANVLLSWRIFVTKQMVWWPLIVTVPITYFYVTPLLLQKHSKKLFDMCNVGEEFYLGRKRNQVLNKCNQILNTEDF